MESGVESGITLEMNLKKIIAESREIAQAINGFAEARLEAALYQLIKARKILQVAQGLIKGGGG